NASFSLSITRGSLPPTAAWRYGCADWHEVLLEWLAKLHARFWNTRRCVHLKGKIFSRGDLHRSEKSEWQLGRRTSGRAADSAGTHPARRIRRSLRFAAPGKCGAVSFRRRQRGE